MLLAITGQMASIRDLLSAVRGAAKADSAISVHGRRNACILFEDPRKMALGRETEVAADRGQAQIGISEQAHSLLAFFLHNKRTTGYAGEDKESLDESSLRSKMIVVRQPHS